MATIEIDVDVYCECGRLLGSYLLRNNNIEVEPCPDCMREAHNEGYQKGRETE